MYKCMHVYIYIYMYKNSLCSFQGMTWRFKVYFGWYRALVRRALVTEDRLNIHRTMITCRALLTEYRLCSFRRVMLQLYTYSLYIHINCIVCIYICIYIYIYIYIYICTHLVCALFGEYCNNSGEYYDNLHRFQSFQGYRALLIQYCALLW